MTKLTALGKIFLCKYLDEYPYHIFKMDEDAGCIALYSYSVYDGDIGQRFNSTTFQFKKPLID